MVQRLSLDAIIVGVIVYTGILFAITFYVYKQRKSSLDEEYFAASREVNVWSLVLHTKATIFSSFLLIGMPGFGYIFGYPSIMLLGFAAFFPLFIYFIGRKVWMLGKTYGFYTPTDILAERYESPYIGAFIAIALIVWMTPFVVVQFLGVSYTFIAASGGSLAPAYAVVFFAVITMLYVLVGGQRVVIWTDTFQGALFTLLLLGLLAFVVDAVGGLSTAVSLLSEQSPGHLMAKGGPGVWNYGTWFSWAVLFGLMNLGQPQIFRSFYYAKNMETLKKSAIVLMPVFVFFCSAAILIGILGKAMWPDLGVVPLFDKPDNLVPAMMVYLVPTWFGVLLLIGVTSAAMSTIDSVFTGFSSMIQKDIFFFADKFKERQQAVIRGKIFIILFTILICVLALREIPILVLVAVTGWGGVLQVVPTIVGGMLWQRGNKYGAAAGTFGGMLLYAALEFLFVMHIPFGLSNAFVAFMVNVMLYLSVSLATKAPSRKTINKFFEIQQNFKG